MTIPPIKQTAEVSATGQQGVKVKVFYTFQGTETTCLSSLVLPIDIGEALHVQVPLVECLTAVCTSCPDMLLNPDADCAVYSANFRETASASPSNGVVWEGHGLLSWVMDNRRDSVFVSGKVVRDKQVNIEVVLQLHPTHRISRDDYYRTFIHGRGFQTATQPSSSSTASPPLPSLPAHQSQTSLLRREPNMGPIGHSLPALDSVRRHRSVDGSVLAPSPSTLRAQNRSTDFTNVLPPITHIPQQHDAHATPTTVPSLYGASSELGMISMKRRRPSPTTSVSLSPPSALFDLHRNAPKDAYMGPRLLTAPVSHAHSTTTPEPAPTLTPIPAAPSSSVTAPTPILTTGRRKKRDTKPPNADDVRTFVEVEKDSNGNYRLPVEIDSWTVLSLGTVVYDRPAFHNQRYIYPVGYKVKKWYRSMVDPCSDTQYTCEILDGGQEPLFRLVADDNPSEVYTGPTPTTVWTIAVRRAFAIRDMDYGHNPVGPDFFGLRKNTIAKMIQDLPNADKCPNYIWQTFKVGTTSRTSRGKGRQTSPPDSPQAHES